MSWSIAIPVPSAGGTLARPTEFGYKARVADTAEGFVIVDVPERGNPANETPLEEPFVKAERAGCPRFAASFSAAGKGAPWTVGEGQHRPPRPAFESASACR